MALTLDGALLGYGRSYAFTHAVSVCQVTQEFALTNPTTPIYLGTYLFEEGQAAPVVSGVDVQFDTSFFAPSPSFELERAVVSAAAFFRTGSAARFDEARCALGQVLASKTLDDCSVSGSVCETATDLAGLLDHVSTFTPVTSDCIGL